MDSPSLVRDQIESGRRLLAALDAVGLPVPVSFWHRRPESDTWRLVIASPRLDEDASFDVYRTVRETAAGLALPPGVDTPDVQLTGVRDPLVVTFRAFAGTDPAPFIGDRRIVGEGIGDQYVTAAYLFRAERLIGTNGTFHKQFAVRDRQAKRWFVYPGSMTMTDSRLTALVCEEDKVPRRTGKLGITSSFHTIEGFLSKRRQRLAWLRKWKFSNGELTHVVEEVRPVPFSETSSTSTTG